MKDTNLDLVKEMVDLAEQRLGDRQTAVMGIRAVCAWFGGQQIYIPRYKSEGSATGDELRGILSDAVGEADGNVILDVLMRLFGGVQIYIPMENRAFRKEIAREVKNRYDGTTSTQRELCREYKMSFTQLYRLWHEAAEDAAQYKFDM